MSIKIALKASHIYLDSDFANSIFGSVSHAFITYSEEHNQLLVTPITSIWFKKMHKPNQFLLKDRNLKGDKTIAIHEILIDNNIDRTDRELDFDYIEKTKLIKINV